MVQCSLEWDVASEGWLVLDHGVHRSATPLEQFALAMITLGACIEGTRSGRVYSYAEIAAALDMTPKEVEETEKLALMKLRAGASFSPLRDWAPDEWDAEEARNELREYWKGRGR